MSQTTFLKDSEHHLLPGQFAHCNTEQQRNQAVRDFKHHILQYYKQHARPFVWRSEISPYNVVVSEIMLQQTQTSRVAGKFETFIAELPTFADLAAASQQQVLRLWQGLGYNRRALALHKIAQRVINNFKGNLPNNTTILETFPGIGQATAASICAFAFNAPTVFIETNIRAVFIHAFFKSGEVVHDKQIIPLIEITLDKNNPREWYYALMDYGVMLKKKYKNPSRRSKHHTKQSKFKGSDREIRGAIVRRLTQSVHADIAEFLDAANNDNARLHTIVDQLVKEGFVVVAGSRLSIVS